MEVSLSHYGPGIERERQALIESAGCSTPEDFIQKRLEAALAFVGKVVFKRYVLREPVRREVARQLTSIDQCAWSPEAVLARAMRIAGCSLQEWVEPWGGSVDLAEDIWSTL